MNNEKIEIKLLVDCEQHVSQLAEIQFEGISRHWVPNATKQRTKKRLMEHLNRDKLPLTLVALQYDNPIGMVSLRDNDGIRPDLTPWLGSLVVNSAYRKNGIGNELIEAIKIEALLRKYQKLYLLAFDPTIHNWYARLGWKQIGNDKLFNHPVAVMTIDL